MIGIVKLALSRPYTFVVMAVLILIAGVSAAVRTPTDIFPDIDIPVVSAGGCLILPGKAEAGEEAS